jgi:uncharacterized membrane protein YdjX (TVP38/TMEM64 family)
MSKVRRALYLQLATFALVIGLLLLLSRFFPIVELIAAAQQRVMRWGAWSAVGYPLLFALCNILLLPGGLLSVGGGLFFGLWWGFFIVLFGNGIAAAISFALSRSLGQRWFSRKFAQNPTLKVLGPAAEREGWKIIFLSQLHPLFPTSLLNYLFGLTRIRFRTYMLWTSIGRAPGLFLYVYLGTLGQFGLNLALGKTHPRAIEYWTWSGAFFTTALLFIALSRMAFRAIQSSQRSVVPDGEGANREDSEPRQVLHRK